MGSAGDVTRVDDRRAERRAARRDENRVEILDAAEKVFGDDGITNGSLRKIAAESGFSTAAIYLFFDSKPHLVAETLTRRGDELMAVITEVAERDSVPLDRLHQVIDDTIAFFTDRPNFRRMLRHLRGSDAITGPTLGEFDDGVNDRFGDVMTILAGMIHEGQVAGEIRAGDARVLAHLFSVLVNEFILLTSPDATGPGGLTTAQFHGLVDGALREPALGDDRGSPGGRAPVTSSGDHDVLPGGRPTMSYTVDFKDVSTVGLESSPVADALAGLRANEARYFKNKYDHVFTVEPASEAADTIAWIHRILEERDIAVASLPLEATAFEVEGIRMAYVFYESGLSINVMYAIDDSGKRAVGFKLSDGMDIPTELESKFKFARQRSKLAGTIRGSYFVIKGEY
jgi:AcrR family transcriptional regulator